MGISVVMATYNGARFLLEQLESVLAQTRLPDEIVIADDGSSDETEAIIFRFRRYFPALVYLPPVRLGGGESVAETSPLGPSKNFARAMQNASHELIAFSDQDDVWLPERLRVQEEVLLKYPDTLLVHSDARLINAQGKDLGSSLFETLSITADMRQRVNAGGMFELLLKRNIVTGATVMVRRELVASAVPIPASWLHDEWLAMVAAGRIKVLSDPLIKYRQHDNNCVGAGAGGIGKKLSRLFESGKARNHKLLCRVQELADRCEGYFSGGEVSLIRAKLAHEKFRSSLSRRRFMRLWRIMKHRRDYHRFGNGWVDILRDMIQPL